MIFGWFLIIVWAGTHSMASTTLGPFPTKGDCQWSLGIAAKEAGGIDAICVPAKIIR